MLVLAPDQLDDRLALAGVAYRGGRLDEALQLAREATARSDDDLDVARDLVVYLLEAGQRSTAVAILDGYDRVVPLPQHVGAAWLLLRGGREADTPVAVICDGTMPTERTVRTTLGELAGAITDEDIRPPAVIVIGDVVAIAHPDSYPLRNS